MLKFFRIRIINTKIVICLKHLCEFGIEDINISLQTTIKMSSFTSFIYIVTLQVVYVKKSHI
jgi:hypothetical protein